MLYHPIVVGEKPTVVGDDGEKELVRLFDEMLGNEVAEITGYVGTIPWYCWRRVMLAFRVQMRGLCSKA